MGLNLGPFSIQKISGSVPTVATAVGDGSCLNLLTK
jgi:hypothetical protein